MFSAVSVVSVVSQSESRIVKFCVETTENYLFISKFYSSDIYVVYREYSKKRKIGQNRGHKSCHYFLCETLRVDFFLQDM